jgi:hypothetical protein
MKGTTVKQVRYQTGVDILGFPVYMEHTITIGQSESKFNIKPQTWVAVNQRTVKQH